MRALRSSLYANPYEPPVTTVLLESDAADTLESGTHRVRVPGGLVIHEIFETSADDIETATLEAIKRQLANGEQEAHQAMLFYWSVLTWQRVTPGGTILMDKPAPLSREEIAEVFEQLAQHPEYESYRIISHTRDGKPVLLANGKIGA